jgi:hypothetical protein
MRDVRTEINVEVEAVAYAIGKVIARKALAGDPKGRRLDALGQLTAIHELALSMMRELPEEAAAAIAALRKLDAAPEPEDAA